MTTEIDPRFEIEYGSRVFKGTRLVDIPDDAFGFGSMYYAVTDDGSVCEIVFIGTDLKRDSGGIRIDL